MRPTQSLDDDVLIAAKAIAAQQGRTVGEVVSELARRSLQQLAAEAERNGIPLLATRSNASLVALDLVNTLRGEAP